MDAIKPDWVFVDVKEVRHPESAYYIGYTDGNGKRIQLAYTSSFRSVVWR
jgi:hypothetical protein